MKDILESYWKAGLVTLPTKPDKSPDVKGTWKGGISDVSQYKNGIGIICGELSDNLECFDFDNHFGDAKKVLSDFLTGQVKEIYDKYKLPIESTVSGGFHLLFRCDKIEGNQKLAQRPKKDSHGNWIPDTIIETRGEGGYFVADPSEGYKIIRNKITDIACITPDEREIFIETAKSFNTWHEIKKVEQEQKDRPGDIFNSKHEAIDEMKSALLNAGWTETRDKEWCRPEKNRGISATLGKVAENVFYVFSSNAYPFQENSAYTPFQVITLLKYNGDFSAFAKELTKRYSEDMPKPKEVKSETEYEGILKGSHIDLDIPVSKPPVVMFINDYEPGGTRKKRLFTLGNFSCITGKSKSKKTFLSSMFLASATLNGDIQDKFVSQFPNNKRAVLMFDTEQSEYDAYVTAKRVPDMTGGESYNFGAFDLREYNPIERCKIIDFALAKFKDSIGYVVIDGIADLSTAINDEMEASRVVSLLMKWTKVYNCHITVIIHQNKNDNFATGHLGSSIIKKAECVISVTKNVNDSYRSDVSCDLIRGSSDFNDFEFTINDKFLPEIIEMDKPVTTPF